MGTEPQPRVYEVELDLPPRECSPNFRGHTRARAKAIARYRQDAYFLFKAAHIPPLRTPVKIQYTYYLARPATMPERYRLAGLYFPLDDDDAAGAMKAARDALADAGIVPNDGRWHVRQLPVEWRTTKDTHGGRRCVVVRLEEAAQ
jgi:hypothetical protein